MFALFIFFGFTQVTTLSAKDIDCRLVAESNHQHQKSVREYVKTTSQRRPPSLSELVEQHIQNFENYLIDYKMMMRAIDPDSIDRDGVPRENNLTLDFANEFLVLSKNNKHQPQQQYNTLNAGILFLADINKTLLDSTKCKGESLKVCVYDNFGKNPVEVAAGEDSNKGIIMACARKQIKIGKRKPPPVERTDVAQ